MGLGETVARGWRAYERMLRIDADAGPDAGRAGGAPAWDTLRARATYAVAWIFGTLQLGNMVVCLAIYDGWTAYHTLCAAVCVFLFASTFLLRVVRAPWLFASVYAGVIMVGVGGSALADTTGIDTSLVPYLTVSPIVMAFVAGWRTAGAFWVAGSLLLLAMGWRTATGLPPGEALGDVHQQRLAQALFAMTLATLVACLLSGAAQSALRRMEAATARARAAEAAKADFLACMSHELRTPMNGVMGLTEVLLSGADGPLTARQRDLLGAVDETGGHLLAVVNDILDLSKLDAGKVTVAPAPFAPRALCEGLALPLAASARERGVALTLALAEDVPAWVLGDDHRLRQILSNLLSNALKFTREGGVRLDVAASGSGALAFTVTDTGCGVPPDRQAAIFAPFEQAEGGTTRRFGGTGLGLPICRRLAALMGGEVALLRSGPEGSVFRLTLPLPEADAPEAAPVAERPGDLRGLRVLVVDDNRVNLMVAGELLRALGADVLTAEDGAAALDVLGAAPVDLVLMDKHMPVMDGIEAVRRIRGSGAPWSDVPVVGLTADAMEGEEAALLARGFDAYASKPVRKATLAAAARRALAARSDGDVREGAAGRAAC